jgi:hypothetical protein
MVLLVLFPIHTASAFPKTYFDILPRVSGDNVTVTVGSANVLFATAEIGIVAVLGAKSSKKQFTFCAERWKEETNIIANNNVLVLVTNFFICRLIFLIGYSSRLTTDWVQN